MNYTLTVLVVLVAAVVGYAVNRRRLWSPSRIFGAVMGIVASIAILSRPGPPAAMWYVAAFLAPAMGTALLLAGRRYLDGRVR
jgi:hypothetical protein